MYAAAPYSSTLNRSTSLGFLPDLDAPSSYLASATSMDNEMEERQRLEREKQKLFFGSTMDAHSPIQSYCRPTDVTRINHNSAFDGLCVPFGSSNTDHQLYDDPWAARKKQEWNEWPATATVAVDIMPQQQPSLFKQTSNNVYPFHSDVAPSLVFPVDAPQHVSPTSSEDPLTPVSFIMSDEEDDIQSHKRQRGQYNTIYVKQEPHVKQEQDMEQHPYVDYIQQQEPAHYTQLLMPFTLHEQTASYPTVYPSQSQSQPMTESPVPTRRSSMSDSDNEEDIQQRKRKQPAKRKAQPIATHAIENTGAPVKGAKYLHIDGMNTQCWIEHATYHENGVSTDVRLIMYSGAFNGVVVHAGDVGERIVCNRRSNISREFGQYASPTEKILIRVPSEHRPLGQTGNVLTGYGLIRFMQSKKMRKPENQAYRRWLLHHVYQILITRPFTFPKGHALETATIPSTPFTEADFSH